MLQSGAPESELGTVFVQRLGRDGIHRKIHQVSFVRPGGALYLEKADEVCVVLCPQQIKHGPTSKGKRKN